MFKRILQKSNTEVHLKAGNLKPSHLEPRLTNHLGVPASASLLAYEPAQRLLAVGSRDGRIKIFGRDGVEVLFKSPTNAPCKYMEFVNNEGRLIHVTTRNDIEVWDLTNKVLVTSKTWASDITAFAVLQGSPFLYIGDETGQVSVVLFDKENGVLSQMQYNIPAHITLSGLVEPDDANAPSVVSILPQPDAAHNRVCFVYGNGILVLWGVHEAQVVGIRGGTEAQQKRLSGEKPSNDDDEEEKEPCSACWACPLGTVVAVGYTDGDIWLWNMSGSKGKGVAPDFEVNLSSEDFRMPVVLLRWSSSGKTDRGPNGLLYVFGGLEMGKPEAVTVVSVLDPTCRRDLKLRGPFADIFLIPSVTGGANGVVALLTSPGCLEVHEEANLLSSAGEQMTFQPVFFVHPVTSSPVLTAKLVVVSERNAVTGFLQKAPGVLKGYMPPTLPNGSRWPVNGGSLASAVVSRKCLYVTGYENGLVRVWDASTPSVGYVASLNNTVIAESELASVTAIDLCGSSGVLAVGDESGRVFVYKLCAESNQGTCHFINKNEPSSKKTLQHESGFQIFSVVCFHEAAIRSLMVASSSSCIAIGDDAGLVTLLDLESCAVRFHGKCSSTSSIASFCFMNVPSSDASSSASSKNESSIVFVLSRDATITCFDGKSGNMVGSGRPKHPSVAVSLHLLDPTGATVRCVNRTPTKKTTKQSVVMAVIETDQSGAHIEPAAGSEERDEDIAQDNDWTGTDNMLLLCAEDSLRLYSISAVLQGMRTTIRKIRLENRCCSASTFEAELHGYGVLLLYDTGDIEIRSLPELEVLKICPLSACLSWEITSPSFFRTFAPACNGRIAAVEAEREVLFMSVVADENDIGLPGTHPLLYDKDIATATEAAMRASFHQPSKKKQNQLQDLFGGVMKEIKHSLGTVSAGVTASASASSSGGDRIGGDRVGGELLKLFSRPLNGASAIAQRLKPSPRQALETPSPRSNTESVDSPSTETEKQLDIDDIDLDDDDFRSPSPSGSSGKKVGVMKKLKSSFKGKKRTSIKGDENEERNMLFEGGTKEGKAEQKMPTMRTAEEIRAAYGHKKAGEASSAAAHARDRLMERQERLQNINRRTEEMQENAENFQSMAEELAKKMEARKWWEI